MNILIDALPTSVEIDGEEYALRTDFRYALRVLLAFEDNELAMAEKSMIMLNTLYQSVPTNYHEAMKKAVWFLDAGLEGDDSGLRLYSVGKDSRLIYSAFKQTHGIDLQNVEMHWWMFVALFMDLGDTVFTNLISLRKRVKTGKATKEEKRAARDLGDMFDVPEIDERDIEDREAERLFLEKVAKSERMKNANQRQ